MKGNILLVTMCGKNYGAVLQAYALSQALKKREYSVSVLNYSSKDMFEQFRTFRRIRSIKDCIYNMLVITKCRSIRRANSRFISFRNEHFTFTRIYRDEKDIISNAPDAKIYVVGSDQVWNPKIKFSPVYYLDFGSADTHRFSYSASIGVKAYPPEYTSRIKHYLQNFHAISVREKSAESLLCDIGVRSTTTVDPTLLLQKEKWTEIAKEPADTNYILVYSLYNNELLKSVTQKLKNMTRCKIICIATSVRLQNYGDKIIWDAGPGEFVGLIKNASYVVTSSYHGMLFSLIYEKPFFVIPPDSTSSRFTDFLDDINLQNRIIRHEDEVTDGLLTPVKNNQLLVDFIKRSNDYIDSFE